MTLGTLMKVVKADLFRYGGAGFWFFLRTFVFNAGFSCTFWFRLSEWIKSSRLRKVAFFPIVLFRRRSERVWHTVIAGSIGEGLYVGHAVGGGIIINGLAKIGKNCNIHHGVTIGVRKRSASGLTTGVPEIGDNVYIGPGAKVFGGIKIGNNVAIGANAVVTRDVPDNAVVGGVPAKVISFGGTDGLVNRRV